MEVMSEGQNKKIGFDSQLKAPIREHLSIVDIRVSKGESDHTSSFPWTLAQDLMSVCWVTNSEPEGPQRSSSGWTVDGIKELLILSGMIMELWLCLERQRHTPDLSEKYLQMK